MPFSSPWCKFSMAAKKYETNLCNYWHGPGGLWQERFAKAYAMFVVVWSLSCVWLFATPCTTAHQASLSFTISQSLLKLMSIELVMPSNLLIPCHPVLLLPPIPPSIRVFSNKSILCMRWPKYWSFSLNISPFNEYSWLISFKIECVNYFVLCYTQVTYSCWIPLSGMCCKVRVWDWMRNGHPICGGHVKNNPCHWNGSGKVAR